MLLTMLSLVIPVSAQETLEQLLEQAEDVVEPEYRPERPRDYRFSYSVYYDIGGYIEIEREIGEKCFSGAFMTQNIKGYGEITKTETINIAPYIMAIDQKMDWTVPPGAIEGLVVTTVIELCARPMSAATANYLPITAETGIYLDPRSIVLQPPYFFSEDDYKRVQEILGFVTEEGARLPESFIIDIGAKSGQIISSDFFAEDAIYAIPVYELLGYEIMQGDIISPYNRLVVDGKVTVKGLTQQIWATEVMTNPGYIGSYHADFVAAYGPGPYEEEGIVTEAFVDGRLRRFIAFIERDNRWWFDYGIDEVTIGRGEFYVGNYFNIEQYVNTTSGELRRITSMSDPLHNLFFEEEYSVVDGSAEVREAFSMQIIERGRRGERFDWWAIY